MSERTERSMSTAGRNLAELHRAARPLTYLEQRDRLVVLVGALAGYVRPEDWDSCLNTTYSYTRSVEDAREEAERDQR